MKLIVPILEYHNDKKSEERELVVSDNGNSNVSFEIGDKSYFCDRAELVRLLRALDAGDVANAKLLGQMIRRVGYWDTIA